jgi:hypothetical protein
MTNENTEPTQGRDYEAIAKRAYEIFQQRGGEPGYHEQDWQQAERELYPEGAPPPQQQSQTSNQ